MLGKALLQALLHAVYRNKSYLEYQVSAHRKHIIQCLWCSCAARMLLKSVQHQRCMQNSVIRYLLRLFTAPSPQSSTCFQLFQRHRECADAAKNLGAGCKPQITLCVHHLIGKPWPTH